MKSSNPYKKSINEKFEHINIKREAEKPSIIKLKTQNLVENIKLCSPKEENKVILPHSKDIKLQGGGHASRPSDEFISEGDNEEVGAYYKTPNERI